MLVSQQAHGSVWALIKRVLVMNELVGRACMTMELPNYGSELIPLSPLHAISICWGRQGSLHPVPLPRLSAPAMPMLACAQGLGTTVPAKAARGGSPSTGTRSVCLGGYWPRHPVLGTLSQAPVE